MNKNLSYFHQFKVGETLKERQTDKLFKFEKCTYDGNKYKFWLRDCLLSNLMYVIELKSNDQYNFFKLFGFPKCKNKGEKLELAISETLEEVK